MMNPVLKDSYNANLFGIMLPHKPILYCNLFVHFKMSYTKLCDHLVSRGYSLEIENIDGLEAIYSIKLPTSNLSPYTEYDSVYVKSESESTCSIAQL